MKIKYLAHASFLITSDAGTRLIADPYTPGKEFKYAPITEAADFVTVSHEHFDHSNLAGIKGKPKQIKEAGQYKDIKVKTVLTEHDDKGGKERGKNTIFCFEVDNVRICHAGDLGHFLTDNQVTEIHKVHVLLIPVGGIFTIDGRTASEVCDQVRARIMIPMHYKTEKSTTLPISGVEEFLKYREENVSRPASSEVSFNFADLPVDRQVIILKPSL